MSRVAMIGAGSWGTTLAVHLAEAGHEVSLWGNDPAHLAEIDAQADDFDEAASAAHDFVDSGRVQPGEVAGAEFLHGAAGGQVAGMFGVAQHHVRAGVDKFAVLQSRDGIDAE